MTMARNERGWVLIDALIGLVVVSIALTALAVAYRQSAAVTISSSNQARAVYVAQQAVEELKHHDNKTKSGEWPASIAGYTVSIDNTAFTVSYAMESVAEINGIVTAAVRDRIKPVRVTVSWTEPGAGAVQIQVVGYYYMKK